MIPLSYFLVAWSMLLAIFGVILLITLIQILKHGLSSAGMYVSTFLFLIVTAAVIIGTAWYASTVDWSVTMNLIPTGIPGIAPTEQGVTL